MATLKIPIDQEHFNTVTNDETAVVDLLLSVIKTPVPFARIIEHLSDYHRPDGGSIEINDFNITGVTYDKHTNKGQVKLSYRVYYFYGCADITKDAGDHETWNFTIDTGNATVIIYLPEYDQRTTAEEF